MRIHWPLVIMGTLFAAPLIAAIFFLKNVDHLQLPKSQHGSLIAKPYAISLTQPEYIAGTTTENKWTLVYVAADNNDLSDLQLNTLRNLRTALNADKDRVSIVTVPKNAIPANVDENSLLILDPRGLHIMYYSELINHRGVLADLRKLLKYSHA